MKKSIKYAGIAAATLLAVAPVAAPVVSQAAVTDGNTVTDSSDYTDDQISGAVSSFQDTLVNKTFGSNSNNNGDFPDLGSDAIYTNYNKYMDVADFSATTLGQALNQVSATDKKVLADQSAQIKITANGYSNKDDFKTYAQSLMNTKGSITFSYTVQYNDKAGNQQTTPAKSFTLTNAQASSDTSIAATFSSPYNVTTGSNVANAKVSTSTDFQLKNKDGDKLNTSSITMGNIYKSLAGAKAGDTTDTYTKATFDADTYYQPITITLQENQFGSGKKADGTTGVLTASDIINGYNNGTDDYVFTVNGGTPTAANSNYSNATGDQVTVIRQIKAGDNNSASWTKEDVKGIVTTKSDHAIYTLKNGENKTISNRGLGKNTPWQTNALRTNSVTGEKQYRVGADEWVDANDVTFSDKTTDNSGEGAYTDVTAVTGMKVHLADPSSFMYMLYNDEGKLVTGRALSGDSNWAVDKKAVNADGVTVYRVATNEWVQAGTGVSFIAR